MNRELKELLAIKLDNYPTVFKKVAAGEMTYDEFFEWANTLSSQAYFKGKSAVVEEHRKDIPAKIREIYTQ